MGVLGGGGACTSILGQSGMCRPKDRRCCFVFFLPGTLLKTKHFLPGPLQKTPFFKDKRFFIMLKFLAWAATKDQNYVF